LRRARWGFASVQELARRTSPSDGSAYAKEHFAIQTRRVRLHAQHYLLWDRWNIVLCIWFLSTQVAGIASSGLFDDRLSSALRGGGKLFGEQEI